jgi:hypothetical protein
MMHERPYQPSWIDRFNDWAGSRSARPWVFYLGLGVILIVVQALFLRLEEGSLTTGILPVILFNGFFTPFLLGLIYLLDGQAVIALNSMRSVLDINQSEFHQIQFKLSNMPPLIPLLAGSAALLVVFLMESAWTVPVRYSALEGLPVFTAVFHLVDKSSAFLFGAFIYHTIRQLSLVNTIHASHVQVNPFNLGPLRSFSRLTASTAVGLVAGVYGWMLINPDLWADPLILGFAVVITILAITVFVWPLYGIHRRMEEAKEKALRETGLRFEAIFSKFNQRLREEDYPAIQALNGTISSLEIQHRRVRAISTWPWRPETARFALTAIALPLILMVLQFLAERIFG